MASAPAGSGTVVWTRGVDHVAAQQRWGKFGRLYVIPMVVVWLLALLMGGVGAFLGVLILLGAIGLLLAAMVWLQNHNAAANATIELVEGQLVLGRKRVTVASITAWACGTTAENWDVRGAALGNPMSGSAALAQVHFRTGDDVTTFVWAAMGPEDLEHVRLALNPHIAAPFVTVAQLYGQPL